MGVFNLFIGSLYLGASAMAFYTGDKPFGLIFLCYAVSAFVFAWIGGAFCR